MTSTSARKSDDSGPDIGGRPDLISVLIVNYNYARFLPEAVESALQQTYEAVEIVICDDGSKDDSREVIESYARDHPQRIKTVFKENGGVASALNAAFEASSGHIVTLLDADDRFGEDKLALVSSTFQSDPAIGIVVNRMVKFSSDAEMTGLIPQAGGLDRGWIGNKLLRSGGHWSFAPASGISLRRDCALQIFPIPEQEFRSEADSYLFTQAPLSWAVGAIDDPVSFYRLHSSNLTSSDRITVEYAQRVLAGIERMCRALSATASKKGLPLPRVEDNPVHAEMTLVRDYLEGAGIRVIVRDLRRLWRAAYRTTTADRSKWKVKPFVLSATALLPRRVGVVVLESMYLPTNLRQRLAGRKLRREGAQTLKG